MSVGRKVTIEFLGKDSTSKTAAAVEKRFGKLGSRLDSVGQKAGKVLAGGLIAGGAMMVKFGDQASDLAETQSKVNQIFGADGAAALDKFAESAAKNLGQSKQTALDAASTFGIVGKSAKLSGSDLVDFSTDMTTLASDMASFNNTSPEEAIEAIGAAMRGEAEPIRKYGVLLDDATLRNEALKLGLVKTTKEALTPQQKVLAAQAAIMKQTKDQQGDFARTSDGLANKQRILKAQLANVTTELGAKALPVMLKVVDAGAKMLAWADNNRTTLAALAITVGSVTAAVWGISAAMRAYVAISKALKVATIIATNVQWALNLAMAANPVGLVIVAIAALVAGLVIAYKKSETFRKIVDKAFSVVKGAAMAVFGFFKKNWPLLLTILTGPIGAATAAIIKSWGKIKDAGSTLVAWVKAIPSKLRALGGAFKDAGRALIDRFVDGIKNAAGIIGGIAGNVWSTVKGLLNAAIDRINAALEFTISLPGPDIHINTPNIPHLARGTRNFRGGLALVGEEGPELVGLPRGASVTPAAQTAAMLGGGGGGRPIVVQFSLDGKIIEQSLIRRNRLTGQPLQVRTL